jgi:hypothetical protein
VTGAAIMVARIATEEITESEGTEADDGKDPVARRLAPRAERPALRSLNFKLRHYLGQWCVDNLINADYIVCIGAILKSFFRQLPCRPAFCGR